MNESESLAEDLEREESEALARKAKPSWLRRHGLLIGVGAAALVFGVLIGGAGKAAPADAAPAPVKTVTVTKEVEVEVPASVADGGCREVAEELFSMLATQNEKVVLPLAQGGSEGIQAILDGRTADVQDAIAKINGANDEIRRLTVRATEIKTPYTLCINP